MYSAIIGYHPWKIKMVKVSVNSHTPHYCLKVTDWIGNCFIL